jgi:Tfp pilus assembly protein PilF
MISTPAQQYYRSSRWELMTALAMTKYNQGELDEATQLLWQVISNYPTAEEPYKVLAGMYHENEPEKELEVWKRQVENTPLDLQALNNVSRWLILEKRYDEALPYLERVVSVDPNNFNGNCHLGQIYQTRNDCPAARTYFLKAGSAAITPEQNRVIHDLNAGLDRQCGRQ